MAVMEWSEKFELGVATMDDTHREFADALNALAAAADAEMLAELDAFIAHTEAHFAQENRWMSEIPFPPIHCHVGEHDNVLGVMRTVREHVEQGNAELGRVLARELVPWFELHASTMDAMLAHVIKTVGYDAARGGELSEAAAAKLAGCGCGTASPAEGEAGTGASEQEPARAA